MKLRVVLLILTDTTVYYGRELDCASCFGALWKDRHPLFIIIIIFNFFFFLYIVAIIVYFERECLK